MTTGQAFMLLAGILLFADSRADGALDADYGYLGRRAVGFNIPGGTFFDGASSSVLQHDGRLVVAGASSGSSGDTDFAVARLLGNGSVDTQFGSNGGVTIHFDLYQTTRSSGSTAYGVAIQSDGKIVLAGTANGSPFAENGGPASLAMVRLLPDGTPDTSFGGGGNARRVVDSASGRALALLPNGLIAVAGSDTGMPHLFVFDHNGVSFNTSVGVMASDTALGPALALAVDSAGRIVVAGYFDDFANESRGCFVARFVDSAAAQSYVLDEQFGGSGLFVFDFEGGGLSTDECDGVALQPDGKIVVIGEGYTESGSLIGVARLLADGSALDPDFFGAGKFTTYFETQNLYNRPGGVKLQSDGKIVIVGSGGVEVPDRAPQDIGILRLNRDGTLDGSLVGSTPGSNWATVMVGFEPYFGNATGEDDQGFALSIDSADRIYAVGAAQLSDNNYDMAVTRLVSEKIFVAPFDAVPQ